ncbi:MAG TPA: hypothetical protein PK880_12890 [Candidatus Competibacter sp.]|nr:hypothetical protein [Candidatus Competibacteraceae bacterium]HRC73409.1 hypothetical protein [Candidatus Competibacter sp.]
MNDPTASQQQAVKLSRPPERITRIPRAAQARLLLHDPESDSCFAELLREALPDEAARLAYLNHLAWEGRS